MAASCIDSTRILLNSKSGAYPNGIGNSSDVIGRYLCEQIRFHMFGFVPELMGARVQNDDGINGEHIYMPRFNHRDGRKRDYIRGFGMQFWGAGAQDNAGFAKNLPGFGMDLKRSIKQRYPAMVALHPYGETLPRRENRVTVEGTPVDKYGIPIARIEYQIGDNERAMAREMYDTAEAILHAAKAEILPYERLRLGFQWQRDSRARNLPHGRRSKAIRAQRILPDARSEECFRGGWLGFHQRIGEESHADDSGAGLARNRLHGGGNARGKNLASSD